MDQKWGYFYVFLSIRHKSFTFETFILCVFTELIVKTGGYPPSFFRYLSNNSELNTSLKWCFQPLLCFSGSCYL